jgi:hypothetical protein
MDKQTIIYLVFIVAYLAFTFYRKSQAKGQKSGGGVPKPDARKPKSMLEKMILGEEFFEEPKTADIPEPESGNQQPSTKNQEPILNAEAISLSQEKNREPVVAEAAKKEVEAHEQIAYRKGIKFNLRQAMIYKVLLDRPYN